MFQRARTWMMMAAVVLASQIVSAQKVAVPQYVPSDVQAFVSIVEANEMWAAFAQTPLYKELVGVWQLPQVQNDPDLQEFQLLLDKASVDLGFSLKPADLFGEHLKGADLYITQAPGANKPNLLVVSRFSDAAKANAVADFIEGEIRKQSEDRKLAGLEPLAVQRTDLPGGVQVVGVESENLYFTSKDDLLFLSSSNALMADSLASPGESRLLENAALVENFGELSSASGQVTYYFSGSMLASIAQAAGNPALGSAQLPRSTAGTLTVKPTRIESSAYMAGLPASGALLRLASVPGSDLANVLRYGHANALMTFAVNTLDGPAMLAAVNEQAKTNPQAAYQVEEMLNRFRTVCAENGLSFDTDVLEAFGPETGFFFNAFDMTNMAAPNVDFLAVAKIRDREKADKVLAALERAAIKYLTQQAASMGGTPPPAEPTVESYANATVRSTVYNHPLFNVPMGLTTARTEDGYLLISLTPQPVKSALDRGDGGAGSLLKSPALGAARAALLPEYNQFVVVNVEQIGATLQMFLPMLMARMQGSGQDMTSVNQLAALVRSVGTVYVTSAVSPDGNRIGAVLSME